MSPIQFDSQSVGLVERIWNKIGAPAIVLVVLFLFYAGYFTSPITRMESLWLLWLWLWWSLP